jgi:hypothetical protein
LGVSFAGLSAANVSSQGKAKAIPVPRRNALRPREFDLKSIVCAFIF